jgi:hypothetical protein
MVVRDCEAAMQQWIKLGVGPFFTMTFEVDDFVYRGKPSPAPVLTLCFAHTGPVQIELIQQHNAVPSAYTEFLDSGREGCQHLAAWYEDHETFRAKKQDLVDHGLTLVQTGGSRASDAFFAYFETTEPGGLMIELSEALVPSGKLGLAMMLEATQTWDGSDPIRRMG